MSDANDPVRTAVALLTAGVTTSEGLTILEQITDELDRDGLVDLVCALVGFTRQIVTDEQLQRGGIYLA